MFYKKGLDITNAKECFEFLHNHFTYDVLNSWNNIISIANNVKLYNLRLDGDWCNVFTLMNSDPSIYMHIEDMIADWKANHPGYSIYQNGRSGGYLVLVDTRKNRHAPALPDVITEGDYEEFKEWCKDFYGGIKHYTDLRTLTELVRDFDKLCDDIRDYLNELSLLDPVKELIDARLEAFNEEYAEELYAFNLPKFILDTENKIKIADITKPHKSLIKLLVKTITEPMLNIEQQDSMIVITAK